jgi:hypothetical protein
MITGEELIGIFKKSCEKSNKLFIPDSPRQEAVAEALAKHYDGDNLTKAIAFYVKSRPGPFLVFDFAVESKAMVDKIKFEEQASNRFKEIVKQTQERMENE